MAAAAALNVTEPCSTGLFPTSFPGQETISPRAPYSAKAAEAGIGGDAFCLFFDAATREVTALMGAGAAPQALTLQVGVLLFSQFSCRICGTRAYSPEYPDQHSTCRRQV